MLHEKEKCLRGLVFKKDSRRQFQTTLTSLVKVPEYNIEWTREKDGKASCLTLFCILKEIVTRKHLIIPFKTNALIFCKPVN